MPRTVLAASGVSARTAPRGARSAPQLPGAGCIEQVVSYDALGRKASESVWKTCGQTGSSTSFSDDGLGRVTSVIAPDGKESTVAYVGVREIHRTRQIGTTSVTTRQVGANGNGLKLS